jgi:pyruvate kinase
VTSDCFQVFHGFFRPDEANDMFILENLSAPNGNLPLKTSGGHLTECYMHGMSLIVDAICSALRHTAHVIGPKSMSPIRRLGSPACALPVRGRKYQFSSLTSHLSTARCIALALGVHSALVDEVADTRAMTDVACSAALKEQFAGPGDAIVIAAGVPFGRSGTTNLRRLVTVQAQDPGILRSDAIEVIQSD